jgi:hypothetical protein
VSLIASQVFSSLPGTEIGIMINEVQAMALDGFVDEDDGQFSGGSEVPGLWLD